ncbi:secretion protein F [Acetobacterium wieringae]|uniref:Secretion protein F n=1 Tax=Acetobacterium wieringae TaxID=52694 RepID=A0ABY6HIP5_9FIRM|nr:secretion protein F [Acetobacterium wieringae]UYO64417.1 secretion protein F [Acetobacterium wieringae]VUZ25207.1 Uncharacterised protein [Acetobacterium wieringae]
MKTILYLIAFIILFIGIFKILSALFEVPNHRITKTITLIGKSKRQKQSIFDDLVSKIAEIIIPFVHINPYKQKKMSAALMSLGINKTPEMLHSEGMAKLFLTGALAFVFLFIIPLISLALIVLAILLYVQAIQKPFELLEKRRKAIERELPRFCSNIEQELKNTHDVLGIITNYRKNAGEALGEELEITIADMKSSNYENALTRLEGRINSGMLSNIVRGLTAVLRGDDNQYYFNNLSMELRSVEINELKLEGAKRPRKIKKYIALIMAAFIGGFFVIVGYQILTLLPKLF